VPAAQFCEMQAIRLPLQSVAIFARCA